MTIDELVQAVQSFNGDDAFRPRLSLEQWRSIAPYLVQGQLRAGDMLVRQGDTDRTMYLLGKGNMQVYAIQPEPGAPRIALLRPGAVVGEMGLFNDGPRSAHVEAVTACTVWSLRSARLDELSQRLPTLAYEWVRAAGAVMAVRWRRSMMGPANGAG
jgi:CRP/FNR family transcriptional regulator, cyclic AMP receptor protein